MKCKSCENDKYLAEPNNCIEDITNYYYFKEDKIYKKCFLTCYSCYNYSNETQHNCKICKDSYLFIYNEKGKCINENEKPSNTYLDLESNTYKYYVMKDVLLVKKKEIYQIIIVKNV